MSILIKLYNGEIYPAENFVPKSAEYKQAAHAQSEAVEALTVTLSDEQKKLFQAYQNACAKAVDLIQTEIFKQSFKLGVQFQKEMTDKDCLPDNE
jgi:hypothetical protein